MRSVHLGDSYDLVKRHLLQTLHWGGEWAVHPMLTEGAGTFGEPERSAYVQLLGLHNEDIISWEPVPARRNNRVTYFQSCQQHTHVFLDPNTGYSSGQRPSRNHLYEQDLLEIAGRPGQGLTMIFDQSTSRLGLEEQNQRLTAQLRSLQRRHQLSGLAYVSHACFILIGQGTEIVGQARELLLTNGHIPLNRLVE